MLCWYRKSSNIFWLYHLLHIPVISSNYNMQKFWNCSNISQRWNTSNYKILWAEAVELGLNNFKCSLNFFGIRKSGYDMLFMHTLNAECKDSQKFSSLFYFTTTKIAALSCIIIALKRWSFTCNYTNRLT